MAGYRYDSPVSPRDTTGKMYSWICVGDHTDVPPSDPYTVEEVFSEFHCTPYRQRPRNADGSSTARLTVAPRPT